MVGAIGSLGAATDEPPNPDSHCTQRALGNTAQPWNAESLSTTNPV